MDLRGQRSSEIPLKKTSVCTQIRVLMASILCIFIVNTCQFSFLKLFSKFVDEKVNSQTHDISHIALISSALFLLSSCLYGVVVKRKNVNKVCVYSSFISFAALFIGSFSRNVDYFIFSASMLTGFGLSGLNLSSIVVLSFTFRSRFPLVLALVLCVSKASHFLHEPFTDLLISTYNWDGTCQILAALCLNGYVCALMLSYPNNIETFELEWLFDHSNLQSQENNNLKSEVGFKDSYVIQSILHEKEKGKDESTKSLDGCIITNDNTIMRPPSGERLLNRREMAGEMIDCHCSLQKSHITLNNSSSFSLSDSSSQNCYQMSSTFQYSKVPPEKELKDKSTSHPSNLFNFIQMFKNIPFLIFCASFVFAYNGIFIPSSFIMRRALFQGLSIENIKLLFLLSNFSEMFHYLFIGLILQIKQINVSVFYSGLLMLTCVLVVLFNWAVTTPTLITFVILFGFSKAGESLVRVVLIRRLFGQDMFTQAYCINLLFESLAVTLASLTSDTMKGYRMSFEWVIVWSSVNLSIAFFTSTFAAYAIRNKPITQHTNDSKKDNTDFET